jgi:DNA-binding beta-propeller fold protein YncE
MLYEVLSFEKPLKMLSVKISTGLLLCFVSMFSATEAATLAFPTQSLPGVSIGSGLGSSYETSGIVWHSRLQRFFTVDDGGRISSMDPNGNNVIHFNLHGDFEGITIADPDSNFIYVGREGGNSILEFDIASNQPTRVFQLRAWMGSSANSGLEALTFVADENDPEGGLFYAGKQSNGLVYAFRLPIASSSTSNAVSFQFQFQAARGRTDLSGMHYDNTNKVLYAIWDSNNIIRAMRSDGTFLEEWRLPPGTHQEGITFQDSNLVISQDNGPVFRYPFFPLIVPEPSTLVLLLIGLVAVTIRCRL